MTITRLQYIDRCLDAIDAPHNNVQHVSLMTRITYEWGNLSGHGPKYNALDLTQKESGCTPFNSFGPDHDYHVWNYPTIERGAMAFHDIMQGRMYAKVLTMLQQGGTTGIYHDLTADEVIAEWNRTPWGYCPPVLVGQTRKNFDAYARLLING